MPERPSPATARRRLCSQLRFFRQRAQLAQTDVVKVFAWSLSKLIRIENGSVGVSVTDVMAFCSLYQESDDEREQLLALAVAAKDSRWWDEHRHVVSPQLQRFLGFEADATRVRQFQPMVVPGLLQVESYARAVGAPTLRPMSEQETEDLVTVRLKRQQHVLFGPRRPQYTALIDESVLHRQTGGPGVMAQQLSNLVRLAKDGIIALGILPFTHGAPLGVTGGFHIMEFNDDFDDAVLYLEDAHNVVALQDKPALIELYRARFDDMMKMSAQRHRRHRVHARGPKPITRQYSAG